MSHQPSYHVKVIVCGLTYIGPTRDENQDAIMAGDFMASGELSRLNLQWSALPPSGLRVAVVDGMGGYAGGREAATIAAIELTNLPGMLDESALNSWFGELSDRISHAGQTWGTPELGATLAVLELTHQGVRVANIGDCRVYRQYRNGRLAQLSRDDRTSNSASSAVTQSLGGYADLRPLNFDAHLWQGLYAGGAERYLICSDGVWDELPPGLLDHLSTIPGPLEAVNQVKNAVDAHQGRDNASIIIIDLVATAVGPPGREG